MRRVQDQDDPNRCRKTAASGGQCWNESWKESDYCRAHGGVGNQAQEESMNYLSEQFANRMKISSGAIDEIKLLRENLINLNSVIAARTSLMTDEASMLVHAGPVADLIMKAEKVTASLHRLAIASGLLLAQPALTSWGRQIVQAIADMVEDKYDGWQDDILDLSDRIADIIILAKNVKEEK